MMVNSQVLRGKGAFYSDCETLSNNSYLGGCWTEMDNEATVGCQARKK